MEYEEFTFRGDTLTQMLLAAIILGQLKPEDSPKAVLSDFVNQLNELEVKND